MNPVRNKTSKITDGCLRQPVSNGVKRSLIIFAKEPEIGKVKTRLKGHLTAKKCLALYKAFLKDTLDIARKVSCEEKIIFYQSKADPRHLKRIGRDFRLCEQSGKDLGEKMHNAFVSIKRKGSNRIVVIGTDSPNLPAELVNFAFRKLREYDVVIGPSSDGGYYLIGLNKSDVSLFKGIRWSSSCVLDATIERAKNLGKSVGLLDEWYDVDDSLSLKRLQEDLKGKKNSGVAKYTRQILKNIRVL